jgi:hypothetical protein
MKATKTGPVVIKVVEPSKVKRLIPILITSYSLDYVLERMKEEGIDLPFESPGVREVIDFHYGIVSRIVRSQIGISFSKEEENLSREVTLRSIPDIFPSFMTPEITQLAIWSYNIVDQIAKYGKKALDRILENPESLSDEPLWRFKDDDPKLRV